MAVVQGLPALWNARLVSTRLVTITELLQAPTGIDWNAVNESSTTTAAESVEQSSLIDRASSRVSNYIYGRDSRCDASTDVEVARVARNHTKAYVDNDGWLWFRTDMYPILSVTSMAWAIAGSGDAPATYNNLTTANLQLYGEGNRVNRIGDYSQDWGFLNGYGLIKTTYVNGWPNAVLATSVAAGSSVACTVDTTLGMTAVAGAIGNSLTIYDGANTEVVTVASVTDSTNFVAATLANSHTPTSTNVVGISAIPADIKWATILALIDLARVRGEDTMVMGSVAVQSTAIKASTAWADAKDILAPYRRII